MSKRGAGEREGYAPSQGNLRKARVEVRRVDAIQVLMAAARAKSMQPSQQPQQQVQQQAGQLAAAVADATKVTAGTGPSPALPANPQLAAQAAPTAPCTHCGTVLPVSADSCCLRQCCGCLDVFCSLCSVLDYEEREDRVFCLGCIEDQTASSRGGGNRGRATVAGGGGSAALLAMGGTTGRWGQLDALGVGGPARSPFPCSRTPQHGQSQGGNRTPGSAVYSNRSHRSFSALFAYGGAGS